ncbi:MAG: 2-dehydropantoate 2-reductase [Elusimicrobia bacterium]|nr:2-dehydropantoate 2-reductase [Elusimicrobiota bacterium]
MKQDPGVLIVGPGSIGRLLACRWILAGRPVRLLARTSRQEALLARGMTLTDTRGKRQPVRGAAGARKTQGSPWPRAAFFCVKSGQVRGALAASRPWIGPETVVVALQNGLGHEDAFRRAFGKARTIIGSCFVAAAPDGDRGVRHTGGRRILLAGCEADARAVEAAGRLLRAGGWKVRVVEDEAGMLWTKLVTNASVNLLGAAANAPNGDLVRDPGLAAVLARLIREGTDIAKAAGHPPLAPLDRTIPRACKNSRHQANSMLQDLRSGRRTELQAIAGPFLAVSDRKGVPADALRMLARVVARLEKKAVSRGGK